MHPTEPPQSPRLPIARHRQYRDLLAADERVALLDRALAREPRFIPGVLRKSLALTSSSSPPTMTGRASFFRPTPTGEMTAQSAAIAW